MKINCMSGARLIGVALAATLVLGGCATDDPTVEGDTTATRTPEARSVEVTASNYVYGGVPSEMDAGTTLELTNESSDEVHEIVAFRLPDDETRSAADLVQLPQEELEGALGGPPATVVVALPDEQGVAVEGDGTLSEPGRYLFLCMIPVGADPAVYEEAMENPEGPPEGPPEIENAGPPHFTQGMVAETDVR